METELITYASLKQCAAAEKNNGITLSLLKAAKNAGCKAFKSNNSVNIVELKDWLEKNVDDLDNGTGDKFDKYKLLKLKSEALLAQIELKEAKNEIITKQDAITSIQAIAIAQKNVLVARLINELPEKLAGQNVIAIRSMLEEVVQELCDKMSTLVKELAVNE